jgi:oxygen-dependent protoporphyrinogen oxidase
MKHIVVVGAGLSGLSAAYRLRELRPDVMVTLVEAGTRAGGWVGTDEREGFLIERGADGFLDEKPAARLLARRLGLESRMVGTQPSPVGSAIVHRGKLEPIPDGFSIMSPTKLRAMITTPLLSARGKARLLLEPLVPRGDREDESLSSFVTRRFGREVAERLAQPLASGIYGADPEMLSLRATMPRFLAEEEASGSVLLGLRKKARAQHLVAKGARYQLFQSFDRGMQVLVDALVAQVPTIRFGAKTTRVLVRDDGVTVETDTGPIEADGVILAVNARVASRLVQDERLANALGDIPHGSAATVALVYPSAQVPATVQGYGFVVPSREGRASIAATYLSRKWPNRAPAGFDIIRVFLGGPSSPDLLSAPTETMVDVARRELAALVGLPESVEPRFTIVNRASYAMPQYFVGHLHRARFIDELVRQTPRLALAGNSLDGVGIPDAIASGERAAARLLGN